MSSLYEPKEVMIKIFKQKTHKGKRFFLFLNILMEKRPDFKTVLTFKQMNETQ
jgi:hypothetical protein